MSLAADLRTLYHLALRPVRGETHAQRLESFYAGQADAYDGFRRRLLHGRKRLFAALTVPEGGVWIDLGAGTGQNCQLLGPAIEQLAKAWLVDLSPSLLAVARRRIATAGWSHVTAVEADATEFVPPEGRADLVTLSYSLSMIPDWFAAIDQARRLLKPGGQIGVVDFYVPRRYPNDEPPASWWTRTFWPAWFALDNVRLGPDVLAYLRRHFRTVHLERSRGRVPYVPLGRVPYFTFIGELPS